MLQKIFRQSHCLISKSLLFACLSLALGGVIAQETETEGTELAHDDNVVSETVPQGSIIEEPVKDELLDLSNGYQAKTVYVDARWGSRTGGSAKALTKSHKKYAAMGFTVVDVDLYLENSDLRGFFVTYERGPSRSE